MIEINSVSVMYRLVSGHVRSLKEYVISTIKRDLTYREFWALREITFSVKANEVVGIVGNNGAGKSTILKVISGILNPTIGTVRVNGSVVPMLELGSGFDSELTGHENIYLNGAILGYTKEFLESKFDEICEFSELGSFINQPLRNYSSGMMMRLAFSIAAIVNPEILIVDEILAVGDEGFQKKSKQRMLSLMGNGTTVLLVSHNIDQIRDLCSRTIWMQDGYIELMGDTKMVCDAYQRDNEMKSF